MNQGVALLIVVFFGLPLAVVVIGVANEAWERAFNRMSPLVGGLLAGGTLFTGVALLWPVKANEFTDCGTLLRQENGYADLYTATCKDARNGVLIWTLLVAGFVAVVSSSMRARSIAEAAGDVGSRSLMSSQPQSAATPVGPQPSVRGLSDGADDEGARPLNTLERQAVEAAVGHVVEVWPLKLEELEELGIDSEPVCAEMESELFVWELGCLDDTHLYFLAARHRELASFGRKVEPDWFVVCAECLRRRAESDRLGTYGTDR